MTHDPDALMAAFAKAGQGQVFAFYGRLSPDARARLVGEAAEIDLAEVGQLVRTLVAVGGAPAADLEGLAPAPFERLPARGGDADSWSAAKAAGEAALREGRVAAFTVAGGQGTRLGYDGPKGTFPVTPVHNKPLFQVFADQLRAHSRDFQ